MDIKTAREVAARIWCDPDFQHIEMDVDLAEEIAQKLLDCAHNNRPGRVDQGVYAGCHGSGYAEDG